MVPKGCVCRIEVVGRMKDWNGGSVGTKIVEWKYLQCRVEVSIAEGKFTIAIAYRLPNWRAKLIVPNLHCT